MFRRTPTDETTTVNQRAAEANVRLHLVYLADQVARQLREFDELLHDQNWRMKEHDEHRV